jgi:putative NADH-flavin reductase
MRITVFGAAGTVGSQVVTEALSRGHQVTAVVRDQGRFDDLPVAADRRTGDAADIDDVARLSAGQDVVIGATRPAPGNEVEAVVTTKALLAGIALAGVRLVIVGGAATLTVPGSGVAAIDDPRFVPPAWRDVAQASADQLEVCRSDAEADWTYLSPPAVLEPGERTGAYRLGIDELLVDVDGQSAISVADLAVALLDEVERPRHRRTRFTVARL